MRAGVLRAIVAALGVVAGVATVQLSRSHPDLSLAGDAVLASAAQLAAGWALIGAGLAHHARRGGIAGILLVASGFAWFAVEAQSPEVGSPFVFTAGLLLAGACPALVVHGALTHASGTLVSRVERCVVIAGYLVCLGAAGIATTAMSDPRGQGCLDCPENLLYLGGDPVFATRLALWLVTVWAGVALATLGWRDLRVSAPLRRLAAPILAPAAVYVGLVGARAAHGIERAFESNDPTDRRIWAGQAFALLAVATGSAWERVRSARMRVELGDLVLELGDAAGGVRGALARAIGEPGLSLVYRRSDGSGWIDRDGRPAERPSGDVTDLGEVAALGHRPGALRDPELVREIARAARTSLENERLDAELKANLAELRASQARVVETGDAERRRLERDLHDGAQQRIVALMLDLRLARRQLARVTDEHDDELAAAEEDLRLAVAELRELAHGLHPHTLQESGLGAALLALSEDDARLTIEALPRERTDAATEFAAYQVVAETLRRVPEGPIEVRGSHAGDRLVVEVRADAVPSTLVFLEDRIGALDGRLTVERIDHRVTLRAELPCAS